MWSEYKEFLFRGNLLDLATAFVLGAAFNAVVSALAQDVIMGTVASFLDVEGIQQITVGIVRVGPFLAATLSFAVVATVMFFVIRAARRFDRRPPDKTSTPDSDEVILLREIRDALRTRS